MAHFGELWSFADKVVYQLNEERKDIEMVVF